MRKILVPLGLSALIVMLAAACSSDGAGKGASSQERLLARRASQKLISDYQRAVKSELTSALNTGGPARAIEVCQKRAPEIGRMTTGSPLVTIRRVSERNRNPENAADNEQLAVLARFAGDEAPMYYDEWVTVDSIEHYRYYEPIVAQAMCLKCHGQYDQIDDATAATLNSLYPNDMAVDYQIGDLRGMFVVDMEWPGARDYINKMNSSEKTASE